MYPKKNKLPTYAFYFFFTGLITVGTGVVMELEKIPFNVPVMLTGIAFQVTGIVILIINYRRLK